MAGFFQQVLRGAAEGFFNDAYLRDFRHASKTFTTDGFSNAPKFKYLFHVYFDINTSLVNSTAFPDPKIPGLLVKNIQLPKFNMNVAEMNQYNRKRFIQTKVNYDPISVVFHDDNGGAIKKIWYNYFSYYYNDLPSAAKTYDNKNKDANPRGLVYKDNISDDQNWGYSGEPTTSATAPALGDPKPNFFNSIKIFGFNQHNFSCYTLINPIIERFEHDTYDYYQPTGTMENRMTIRYETVAYEEGALDGKTPENIVSGFGSEQYYDRLLSPISRPGGNRNILGQGGLVDAAGGIINDLNQTPPNLTGALTKGLNISRTWKNPSQALTAAKGELVKAAVTAAGNPGLYRGISNFPSFGSTSSGAIAQQAASNNVPNTQAPPLSGP